MKTNTFIVVLLLLNAISSIFFSLDVSSRFNKLQGQVSNVLNTVTTWDSNNVPKNIPFRDYQIDVVVDTIFVYNLNRLVGRFPFDYDEDPLSTMIEEDTQDY